VPGIGQLCRGCVSCARDGTSAPAGGGGFSCARDSSAVPRLCQLCRRWMVHAAVSGPVMGFVLKHRRNRCGRKSIALVILFFFHSKCLQLTGM
jgi:hypothetical protein